ncbi:hypothetical protein I316_02102 [Kwoniella heveanensis BCC8398]|uniref:HTH APSES-type domain-containing protein n=1 Tax=Kwoniella heveanensis BCC8398 TaxID=1296120 RepID=A0A1B9GYY0_9TREE|nr:hypothetical protein I316_02102 [Kwoniella heveanensis BCC8398]
MARPLRPAPAPRVPAPASTPAAPSTSTSTPRTSSRPHKPSAAALASGPSTPNTPGPSTPSDLRSRAAITVEAKAHGLRSVGVANERTPCPFPASWGGREKCGIVEEDEGDEVLMGILSSIASNDNRALSAEEIALTCFHQGWLRPPSAAIEPTTLINNAIRSYLKRCEKSNRHCLLAKYQLAGSVVESVLQPALHPNAFDGGVRPKGTVWYLVGGSGKNKWKSPFEGIEVPKVPARKPAPSKKPQPKESKPVKTEEKKSSGPSKGKAKVAPVKIRLVLNGAITEDGDTASEAGSDLRSRSVSTAPEATGLGLAQAISLPLTDKPPKRIKSRRPRDILDSSSESETSESDMDFDMPGPSRLTKPSRSYRKIPPPLPLNGSPRVYSSSRLPQHSPFMDVFFPSPIIPSSPFPLPHASPFPSHSLDNTTWTARHDRTAFFESSSSSSDDEMREPTWGMDSEILVRAVGGDDDLPSWSMEEDEAKVKEATDALRVLFPMSSPDVETDLDTKLKLNQFDNRPSASESPVAASTSFGQLKGLDAGGIPLNAWIANSSPAASPNIRYRNLAPPPDVSPTQHLSNLRSSFDPEQMEVDDETPWLDESGELPVKAEDTFSDVDLGSTIGDAPTPEHDRQLDTALWAQEAAAIRIKQEPEDYPSPATTEDDHSAVGYNGSRASSTPSSGSSELPPFEIDVDNGRMGVDEVILGPESISVEELDGWLPTHLKAERTPHRGRTTKNRHHPSRCSGNWGGIGVGSTFAPVKPVARNRSSRSTATARRRRSSPKATFTEVPARLTPETDIDEDETDAIGTEDLERARIEADAKEEQHRKACKEKAEQQRRLLEAYRQTIRAEATDNVPVTSPWSESQNAWGSTSIESLHISTPGVLSPLVLHSISNMSLGNPIDSGRMTAVDPKALVSPPLQSGFSVGQVGMPPMHCQDLGTGMLDAVLSQQEIDSFVCASELPAAPAPATVPAPPPAPPRPSVPSTLAPLHPPRVSPAPISPNAQSCRPISPAMAPKAPPPLAPKPKKAPVRAPTKAPTLAPAPVQPTPSFISSSTASTTTGEQSFAPTTLPTALPAVVPPQLAAPISVPTITTPATELAAQKPSVSPSPTAASTPSTATSSALSSAPSATTINTGNSHGNGNNAANKPGGKVATITKPLCPGVDACVVDNIPVYAHLFDGRPGQGKQILLRRLDTDFVNANALLHALGVPLAKYSEYLDNPISPIRLAARHVIPPSCPAAVYSNGVSGIWVHLSEAREFARRAKLPEGRLLASLLREDLFQLFATLAGLKPDHPTSESFGLPFVPQKPEGPSPVPSPAPSTASSLSSANSKSTPNLATLSISAPPSAHQHLRQNTAPINANVNKGPLARSAPPTPPDGCPQPKRRRATISSPLAKKPGVQALTSVSGHHPQAIAPAPATPFNKGSAPAAGTRMSIASQKRATRASIGGGVLPRPIAK